MFLVRGDWFDRIHAAASRAIGIAAPAMLRLWRILAHVDGDTWSTANPVRSLGVSEPTVRCYVDALTQTLMVRQLQPWHANLGKRQVKSLEVDFRDSGLLHALLAMAALPEPLARPRSGASWEGLVTKLVLRLAKPDEACFRAMNQSAELDLPMLYGSRRVGVEIKRSDAPTVTKSMRIAIDYLRLDALCRSSGRASIRPRRRHRGGAGVGNAAEGMGAIRTC